MLYMRVPVGDYVMTVRGKDGNELKERIRKLQSDPPKPGTSVVTRSGERVELEPQE